MKITGTPWYVSEPFNPAVAGESYTIRRAGRDRTKWNGYVAEVLCSSPNAIAHAKLLAGAPELFEYVKSSASAGCATAKALVEKIEKPI